MAKICAAFYNAVYDKDDESVMPSWYESFFKGLKERGNELLLFQIQDFQCDYGIIDEMTKKKIIDFNPDVYISFNNVFYDMDFLDCVQLVYEADTPIYWNNLKSLYNSNKMFCVWGDAEVRFLIENYGIDRKQIFVVSPFTEVRAEECSSDVNISFIGSRFGIDRRNEVGAIAEIDENLRNEYYRCIEAIINNPNITKKELAKVVNNDTLLDYIDIPGIIMMMSTEKRVRVLSAIVDLGLDLYGTESWMYRYHFDSRLNVAFKNKKVYSLKHNQDIYNRSKLSINISHYQAKDCFSWRVLDIMASNACLVTDSWSGVKKKFPDLELPIYEDEHQAREICKRLLNDSEMRSEIVDVCHNEIEKKYRFKHHIKELEYICGVKLDNGR